MLRADNVACGTSSTGTGTLTLAACPAPPGGLDFDKWLKATGFNFVSTNAVLVSYTIIEYTSAAFTTAKQTEKGVGTLTLGASITAATLARSLVQSTVTGLDTSTPAPTFAAPTAITIGTAANTLIFVGASVDDLLAGSGPYFETVSNSGLGVAPLGLVDSGTSSATGSGTGVVYYIPFYWAVPMLAKKFTARTGGTAYTGGTSNVYAALYANGGSDGTNPSGRPGKLLIDFGVLGAAGSSLATTFTNISSASHASGFRMRPGLYWAAIFQAFSGGSGSPNFISSSGTTSNLGANVNGLTSALVPLLFATAGATANPAPDPAGTSGYFLFSQNGGAANSPTFLIGP